MRHWFRYFLVGVLVSGMAVDSASARRLFRRRSRCRKCHSKCVKACPTACPVPAVAPLCDIPDSLIVTDSDSTCTAVEATVVDSTCQDCAAETQPAIVPDSVHDTIPETIVKELIIPAPAPVEVDEPTEKFVPAQATERPIEPQSYRPALAPAPLAVPEATEIAPPTSSTSPSIEEPPTAKIVGDRYSNEGDLFGPSAPEEWTTPEPAVEPAADPDDLFDELTPPAEAQTPPETPLPEPTPEESTPEEPATEDPEPQPETDVEGLFGPAEPASEPDKTEEPSQEPEESAPVESEPSDSEEGFDPFGEDLTTRLDERSSVLEAAGGLQSKTDRTWTDSTATFRCEARLVSVTAKNVVLRQSNGANLVVPLARLASDDLHFIHGQITALRIVRAHKAAAEKLAVAWIR